MKIKPLESQTLHDVKNWRTIYEAASKGRAQDSKEMLIFQMIDDFEKFCHAYKSELTKLTTWKSRQWLESTVDGVLMDYWEQIRRAAEQHLVGHYGILLNSAYKRLDEIHSGLVKRLKQALDVDIVLYFGRIGEAKRFPFGSSYLIGVPLNDAYKGDWTAIPHELGHHIFWNTRIGSTQNGPRPTSADNFLAKEVTEAVDTLEEHFEGDKLDRMKEYVKRMLDRWTEEIFADVVGTRIAGQSFVDAGWTLIRSRVDTSNTTGLYVDDGEHPIPYLVPYVRAFAMDNGQTAPVHWDEYEGFDETATFTPEGDVQNPIPVTVLRDTVIHTFVKGIVNKLQNTKLNTLITTPEEPLKELKGLIQNVLGKPSQKDILIAMLEPMVLQKNLEWTCRNKHPNTSWPCTQCSSWF